MSAALLDVGQEREKQRAKWGDHHDDNHRDRSLAAAACYLAFPYPVDCGCREAFCPHLGRMWAAEISIPHPKWAEDLSRKRPTTREQLVTAAALLVAEIERIDRMKR